MYLHGKLTIDPSQFTEIARLKPTKGFGRMAHFLTGGLVSSKEERETFCAVSILQQINVVMRSLEITNIVRLAKDETIFYEDNAGVEGDLKQALDQFEQKVNPAEAKLFNTLQLVLEHRVDELKCLLDIRVQRTHSVAEHPITITINGIPDTVEAELGEDVVRQQLRSIFGSQPSYDAYVQSQKQSFTAFLEELKKAFTLRMRVDDVHVKSCVKIIRPRNRVHHREEIPKVTGSYYAYDPIFHDHDGLGEAFFVTWLWAEMCHTHDIHCRDCTIVDSAGRDVLEVGSDGFQAGEGSTMNLDERFELPAGSDVRPVDGSDYSREITAATESVASIGTEETTKQTGWSFGDLFGGDTGGWADAGGDGGDGGGCGGGCGGG